jgi:transposase, IS30 family
MQFERIERSPEIGYLSFYDKLEVFMSQQLDLFKRYEIKALLAVGKNQQEIAAYIGVHPSTVSRELKRNVSLRGYRPQKAQEIADERKSLIPKKKKLTDELVKKINSLIELDYSPEQVQGELINEGLTSVSPETIYKHIYKDKASGGKLYVHLRIAEKPYRSRLGSKDKRGRIKDRVSIDERPLVVEGNSEAGHWEIDTVVGAKRKGYLVTIVERKTKFSLIGFSETKKSDVVANITIALLKPYKKLVKTITSDNGLEFADHKRIAKSLKAGFYFANPYSSWERGLNENTNGLIRQYFPKKEPISNVTQNELSFVMSRLNYRPRKILGFATPYAMFKNEMKLLRS